jgi:2-hydroxy-5-methyl-1-naphthoate 7-hydroxylase
MEKSCPIAIEPAGTDIHAEGARIRAQGPVAQIELPGGVLAWFVTGYDVAKDAPPDQRLSKDADPAYVTTAP